MVAETTASHCPGSILVVEDNPDFSAMIRQLLEQRFPDAVIETAHDGGSALTLAQYRPGIVLVDLFLPDMSGARLLQRLRNRYQDLPLIGMSLTHREYEFDAKISDSLFMYVSKENLHEKLPALISRFRNISSTRSSR